MKTGKNRAPSRDRRKTVITAAVAAGIFVVAGSAAPPHTQASAAGAIHTRNVATSWAAPALVAMVTPNRLLAAVTNSSAPDRSGSVAAFASGGDSGLVDGPATAPVADGGSSTTAS